MIKTTVLLIIILCLSLLLYGYQRQAADFRHRLYVIESNLEQERRDRAADPGSGLVLNNCEHKGY